MKEKTINSLLIIFSIIVIGIYIANIKINKKTEDVGIKEKYSFINDNEVVGRWNSIDYLKKIEDYKESKEAQNNDYFVKNITFLENGDFQLNDNTNRPWFKWTKGKLYHMNEKIVQKYYIKEISGQKVLFLSWPKGIFEELFFIDKEFYAFKKQE